MTNFIFSIFVFTMLVPTNLIAQTIVFDNEAGGAGGVDSFALSQPGSFRTDDFVFEATHQILGVEWTGIYGSGDAPSADNFLIAIFETDPSFIGPGSLVASFDVGNAVNRLDSGFDDRISRDIYDYSATISFTANAGQRYWVSTINSTPTGVQYFQGNLSGDPAGDVFGNSWRRFGLSGAIDSTEDRLDFRLIGTAVPEPLGIFPVSLIALALLTRRTRRTATL